jgi:hypothetical protein
MKALLIQHKMPFLGTRSTKKLLFDIQEEAHSNLVNQRVLHRKLEFAWY